MAGRRTFRMLTYSQLSGIKVIRPKYSNLYIVMIQCMRKSRRVKQGCRADLIHPIPTLTKRNKNTAVKRQCSNLLINFNYISLQPRKKRSAAAYQNKRFHSFWPQRMKNFVIKKWGPNSSQYKMARDCWVNFISAFFINIHDGYNCSLGKQISEPVMHKSRPPTRPGDHILYIGP
jgi:hypothetical protein